MSWAYSGNPATSSKDAVRYLVGDTDSDEAFITDEEIEWELANNSNLYYAAAAVAFNLSALLSIKAEQIKIGPLVETYQTRSKRYAEVAARMERKAATISEIAPVAGGVTTGTTRSACFDVGMHDFTSDFIDDTEE